MSEEFRDRLREAARRHLEAYNSPDAWDASAIWQTRDPACEHYLQPAESLEPQFRGNINEEAHRHFMEYFGPIFSNFRLDVNWEAVDTYNKIVVHDLNCTMDLKAFGDEPAVCGYQAHYIWTLWFNSDAKVIKVEEMIDIERIMGVVAKRAAQYAAWAKSQKSQ
ncbi:hypothetical protein AMS68_002870 [Peltaster fructicola]|uniref:SnoaL-like domain-containing protein n=1 Tax=Peltaster fructicola TaxID=286661 RepID=A0A6H0XRL9_9PEZI|nr:hypothetical protein AMS68_002870 [Peltaster fructicola]